MRVTRALSSIVKHCDYSMCPVNLCEFVQMQRTDFKLVRETLFQSKQVTVLESYLDNVKYRNYARETADSANLLVGKNCKNFNRIYECCRETASK
jgi:hypothetical protein